MRIKRKPKGQSTVEFLFAGPVVIMFFFLIIQSAYFGYTALAVQRAAIAGAREIALTGARNDQALRLKLAAALAPLARLNRAALAGIIYSRYETEFQSNRRNVRFKIYFPMPIWVPLADRILGVPFPSLSPFYQTEASLLLKSVLNGNSENPGNLIRKSLPYVLWLTFEAETHNEGFIQSREIEP